MNQVTGSGRRTVSEIGVTEEREDTEHYTSLPATTLWTAGAGSAFTISVGARGSASNVI